MGPGAASSCEGSLSKAQGSKTRSLMSCLLESQQAGVLLAAGNGEVVQPREVLRARQDGQKSPARTAG